MVICKMDLKKCEWCDKEIDNPLIFKIFQPFDEEGLELVLCEECANEPQEFRYCEYCCRYIWNNNGRRVNISYDENEGIICAECYQEDVLRHGQPAKDFLQGTIKGDFYDREDLEENNFLKDSSYQIGLGYSSYHGYSDVERLNNRALELIEHNYQVIVNYESLAIGGLGGYVQIWKRHNNPYKRK
jgi:hypothetical protein